MLALKVTDDRISLEYYFSTPINKIYSITATTESGQQAIAQINFKMCGLEELNAINSVDEYNINV